MSKRIKAVIEINGEDMDVYVSLPDFRTLLAKRGSNNFRVVLRIE